MATNYDLSILIPARNEMFLQETIDDILKHIEGNTEIIVVLDGFLSDPPLRSDPRVTLIYHSHSIGQRAATNEAAKLSSAKYVMKVDAHCSFDQGFDVKLMREMQDDWTMVPLMRNLHAFDWICADGHRRYQGPSGPCLDCGKPTTRDILWRAKESPKSTSYCFDSTPHFQYFGEYAKRPEAQTNISETMSLQGSCFLITRQKYWELGVCDESFGSWGSQGIEVAVKTWLSGGRVVCNKLTWYAHLFRTQGGDFGFPYPISGNQVDRARKTARNLFFDGTWPLQIRPLSWLVERFWPVKGWSEEELSKLKSNTFRFTSIEKASDDSETEPGSEGPTPTRGIIYYTDSQLYPPIAKTVQDQLLHISRSRNIPIVSTSLKKLEFGDKNIHFPSLTRSPLTMFKQILAGLENSTADFIYFCEHDVLYHPTHFDFTPPDQTKFYYNENVWKVDYESGKALYTDHCRQVSGICVFRELAIEHYRKRIALVEKNGFSMDMGYEPGTHHREARVDDLESDSWKSAFPNIDIRHGKNLSPTRWSKDQFRNLKNTEGWMETTSDQIPGWDNQKNTLS